jgi:predicted transcriptional regulator
MPTEVARWLVGLRADSDLQARLDELADKNTGGNK